MSKIPFEQAQRLTTLLAGATKGISFYPAGHPAVMQPLQEMSLLLRDFLNLQQEIRMGFHDDVFFFDEHLFITPTPSILEFSTRLTEKAIMGIVFTRGVQQEELGILISLLARKNITGKEMERLLREKKTDHVLLNLPEENEQVDKELEVLETYSQALEAIRDVIKDIEKGRIPSSGKLLSVVRNMVALTIQDPSTLLGLAMIKDYDNYTFNHSVNVGVLSMALCASLGNSQEAIEEVGIAGFLHDIGKTKVEKGIINKPGKLSAPEFEEMKKHSEIGAEIVAEMDGIAPHIAQAVLGHHIRYNHEGYPEWAREKKFGVMSHIIAVADCYDALTTLRVYQRPLNPKAAVDQLHQLAGTVLDIGLVNSFVEMMGKYPVGTLVRLDSGEVAIVYRPNPANSDCPIIKIIFDAAGNLVEPPQIIRLAEESDTSTKIVSIVDPLTKNIEVGKYLS